MLGIGKPELSKYGSRGQHQRSRALMSNLQKYGGGGERDGRRRGEKKTKVRVG